MGADKLDANFTQNVIDATGPKASARTREIIGPLIRHIHDFAREVNLTVDEWMEGVNLINWAGQMSDDRRNEGQLICDVLGLESYVPLYLCTLFPHQFITFMFTYLFGKSNKTPVSSTKSPSLPPPTPQTRTPPPPSWAHSSATTPP